MMSYTDDSQECQDFDDRSIAELHGLNPVVRGPSSRAKPRMLLSATQKY